MANAAKTQTKKTLSYDNWMMAVDGHLASTVFVVSADLPDCNYSDWYESGVSAKAAATKAAKKAKNDE